MTIHTSYLGLRQQIESLLTDGRQFSRQAAEWEKIETYWLSAMQFSSISSVSAGPGVWVGLLSSAQTLGRSPRGISIGGGRKGRPIGRASGRRRRGGGGVISPTRTVDYRLQTQTLYTVPSSVSVRSFVGRQEADSQRRIKSNDYR